MEPFDNPRKYALAITHYVYRNTDIVENNHCRNIVMDMAFYRAVYRSVKRKAEEVVEFKAALSEVEATQSPESVAALVPEERRLSFLRYLLAMMENARSFGGDWDAPNPVEEEVGERYVTFLLGGVFREKCLEHARLNDDAMRAINKDLYDRIYTLVIKGIL